MTPRSIAALLRTRYPQAGWALLLCVGSMVVLGCTIYFITRHLHHRITEQMVSRDAEVLYSVALMAQVSREQGDGSVVDSEDQLEVILETSRLRGVLAARLFDGNGQYVTAFPYHVSPGKVDPALFERLRSFRPVSRYGPSEDLGELFVRSPREAVEQGQLLTPLLYVWIPLHGTKGSNLLGVAEFILDGRPLAREFATLKGRLVRYASWAGGIASALLLGIIGWAFYHLNKVNRALADRTVRLLKANQELTLAAKTAALGNVTAHLIHGLKNPIGGLRNFVASRGTKEKMEQEDWEIAALTTYQLQQQVSEIVRILSEEENQVSYDVTPEELGEIVGGKLKKTAEAAHVGLRIVAQTGPQTAISSRAANLLALIIDNLVQNAIQAAGPGKNVQVRLSSTEQTLNVEVEDDGPGVPPEQVESLFVPGKTGKAGGSGLGLAISKQLARQIEATLELKESAPGRTVFLLQMPLTTEKNQAA